MKKGLAKKGFEMNFGWKVVVLIVIAAFFLILILALKNIMCRLGMEWIC